MSLEKKVTVAVIGDTHIPDRRAALHPEALDRLKQAKPQAILHTGDVSVPSVLSTLEKIAPVYAVQGNRDIFTLRDLPMTQRLEWAGVRIGLAHGHGSLGLYLKEKFHVRRYGYRLDLYLPYLFATFPREDVIVFGHSHAIENQVLRGKLLLNPGSASLPYRGVPPTLAFLYLEAGQARAEIIRLADL